MKIAEEYFQLIFQSQKGDYFEEVINNLPGYVYWVDKNNVILGCNQNLAQLLNINSTSALVKRALQDAFPKEVADEIARINKQVMATHNEEVVDFVVGQRIYSSHKKPIIKNGEVIGLIDYSLDVTAQRKTEEALIQEKEKAEGLIEANKQLLIQLNNEIIGLPVDLNADSRLVAQKMKNYFERLITLMPGHVYWINRQGVHLGCNDKLAKFLKLPSTQSIIGKTNKELPWDLYFNCNVDDIDRVNKQIMAAGEAVIVEQSIQLHSGKYLTFLSSKAPIKDETGEITGLIGISLDITEQKTIEVELKQAKEQAEIANRVKSEFIRNMQHDIRTPFNGIYGMSKMLIDGESDPWRKELLTDIGNCAKELMDYCNSIIDYSRIESGTLPIFDKPFNLRDLVSNTLVMEKPPAFLKSLSLHQQIDDDIPNLLIGDEYRLKRIFINLVSNAIKFTEVGGVSISISNKNYNATTRQQLLKIVIEDTGIGIPKEKENVIYERFTRGSPSGESLYKGQGLGLRIVKQFVDELDGDIMVTTAPNQGTRFTIFLSCKVPLSENI